MVKISLWLTLYTIWVNDGFPLRYNPSYCLLSCTEGAKTRSKRLSLLFVFLVSVVQTGVALASDQLIEMQYAEKIESYVGLGKNLWLTTPQGRFLSLYTETERPGNKGTAILLHARNSHPGQGWFIESSRYYLAEHNWASLAIQLPVLGIVADQDDYFDYFEEARQRIQKAVDFLQSGKARNIVLIGQDMGAMMACYYLAQAEPKFQRAIAALVAVSLPVFETEHPKGQILDYMHTIDKPFLDIYLDTDLSDVVNSARERRVAAKSNTDYRQTMLREGTYRNQPDDELLVKRVYSWLVLQLANSSSGMP